MSDIEPDSRTTQIDVIAYFGEDVVDFGEEVNVRAGHIQVQRRPLVTWLTVWEKDGPFQAVVRLSDEQARALAEAIAPLPGT